MIFFKGAITFTSLFFCVFICNHWLFTGCLQLRP